MEYEQLRDGVLEIARELARRGPGWAQQSTVLSEVRRRLNIGPQDIIFQQKVLTCWHDLFVRGELSWGYDFDNPDAPFFHVSERDQQNRIIRPSQ